ncbi:hypothetical protein LTR94_023885 [Friedmanniomyces endolithicus]|nr:hypothetical protein LTR94_023885 [Friedmanniomyces endolithicus]
MAWTRDDVVVFDLHRDRYDLLPSAAAVLQQRDADSLRIEDEAARDELMRAGYLAAQERAATAAFCAPKAAIEPPEDPRAHLALCAFAATNSLAATAIFKRRTLAELVTRASRKRRNRSHAPTRSEISSALNVFYAVYPWLPWQGDCLQRAFLLHTHLHHHGMDARWVFGVRTWPFLAHCWVQIDDIVVGDSLSRTNGFTPIMAV